MHFLDIKKKKIKLGTKFEKCGLQSNIQVFVTVFRTLGYLVTLLYILGVWELVGMKFKLSLNLDVDSTI